MNHVAGGGLPARVWRAVMSKAHEQLPPLPLPGTYRPGTRIGPGARPFVGRPTASNDAQHAEYGRLRNDHAPARAARNRLSPIRTGLAPTTSLAPTASPPLPTLHKKPEAHPVDRISPEFIARAIGAVPTRDGATGMGLAANPTGFDINAIRQRLERTPENRRRPDRYMALGAGAKNE